MVGCGGVCPSTVASSDSMRVDATRVCRSCSTVSSALVLEPPELCSSPSRATRQSCIEKYTENIATARPASAPQSLDTAHTRTRTASGRVRRLDRVRRDHVAPGTPRRPDTYTVSGTLQPIRGSANRYRWLAPADSRCEDMPNTTPPTRPGSQDRSRASRCGKRLSPH